MPLSSLDICKCWAGVLSLVPSHFSSSHLLCPSLSRSVSPSPRVNVARVPRRRVRASERRAAASALPVRRAAACGRASAARAGVRRCLGSPHAPRRRLGSPARGPPLLERRAARLLHRGAGLARSAAAASCFLSARGAAGQGPRAAGEGPKRGRRAAPRSCRERPARGQEALARCRGGARKGPRTTGAATRQGLNLVW